MSSNFLLILVFGTLPLFLLTGMAVRMFRDKPIERDIVFRLLFVMLLLLPCAGLLVPRWATMPLERETVTDFEPPRVLSPPEESPIKPIDEPIVPESVTPISSPPMIVRENFPVVGKTNLSDSFVTPSSEQTSPIEMETPAENIEISVVAVATVQKTPLSSQAAQPEQKFSLKQLLFDWGAFACLVIWLAGMLPGLFLLIRSRVIYATILRNAEPLCDWRWVDLCKELEATLQLKRPARYRVSQNVGVPQVVGLRQPTVLLPRHLVAEKPNRAILIHELAHIRRNDIAWQLLMSVTCMMYWFQPLVWYFAAAMRNAREEVCDNDVLRFGEKGSEYAAVLLNLSSLIERGYRLPERIGCAVTMPPHKNQVERRILSLLDPHRKRGPIPMKTKLMMIVGMSVAALFSIAICPAFETKQKNQPLPLSETEQVVAAESDTNDVTDPQSIGVQEIPALSVGESNVAIRGLVQWEDGTPVAGADVTLITTAGQQFDLKSDTKGRFLIQTCSNSRWNQNMRMIAKAKVEGNDETRIGMAKTNKDDKEYVITLQEGRRVNGTVTTASGKPLEDFYVGTSEYGFSRMTGTDDFALLLPVGDVPERIYAWADGEGFAYKIFKNEKNRADSENDPLYVELDRPVAMTLEGAAPLTIEAIDTDGKALAGIDFDVWGIAPPAYMVNGELKTPQPIRLPRPVRTGENGVATVGHFPAWASGRLTISPVQFFDGPSRYVRTREFWPTFEGKLMRLVQEFIKTVPFRGTVRYPDGTPVAGLKINAEGQGMTLNDRWNVTTTDAEGKYEFLLPPYQWYVMAAKPGDDWAFPMQDGFAILPGEPVEAFDVVMEPTTKVTIKVLSEPERTPLANRKLSLTFTGRSDHGIERIGLAQVPENFHFPIYRGMQASQAPSAPCGNYTTDVDGNVTVSLGSGCYQYRLEDAREHDQFGAVSTFEIKYDPEHRETVREILVPSGEESLFSGTALIQTSDGIWQGAAGLEVSFSDPPMTYPGKSGKQSYAFPAPKTDAGGKFSFTRANRTIRVLVYDRKAAQAAYATVPASQHEMEMKLQPLVSITGTIVNLETGEPLKGIAMEYRFRYECDGGISCGRNTMSTPASEKLFCQNVITDANGRYVINDLLPDQTYDLHYDRSVETRERSDFWQIGGFRTPKTPDAKPYDVGEIRVASLKPIGVQNVDPVALRREGGDEGSIAGNLRSARGKTEPEYAWSRIDNYKMAILGLIEQDQLDAAKVAATEMVELVDETRKALRAKGEQIHKGRFDDELYAVATAFEAKGEKEAGAEVRKHLEELNDMKILWQKVYRCQPEELDGLIHEIEMKVDENNRGNMIVNLLLNVHMPLDEKLVKIRALADVKAKIQLLLSLSDDFRREGNGAVSDELADEAVALLKNLPTAEERATLWRYAIMTLERRKNMEFLHQAAVEMYEQGQRNPITFDKPAPEIDLEKAGIPGSEERRKLTEYVSPLFMSLLERTSPLSVLVKTGEKEKALKLADEIASFKNVISKEQLVASGFRGFLEGSLAECAETYADCGETEKAKELWREVLDLVAAGPDAEYHSSVSWPVVMRMRNPLFKDDVRKLCLQTIEEMKTYEDENRPELTIFRRIDNVQSRAHVLARYGFTEDAKRALDELWATIQKTVSEPGQLDGYRANIAEGYANAHLADQAKQLAESIENEELRTTTLQKISLPWNW